MAGLSTPGMSQTQGNTTLRLVLPSDGDLYETTLSFMQAGGLSVLRPSARRYTGYIPALPGVEVLFQRTADVTQKVEEGSAELGITGLDRYLEYRNDEARVVSLIDDLRYGRCDFVLAVPYSWLDVASMDDLADLALEFHQQGKQFRIATKYPRLLRRYFFDRGINYFSLVPASGALEAAPAAGYADLIADLSATGTTLRENRLKTLEGGHHTGLPSLSHRKPALTHRVQGASASGPGPAGNGRGPPAGRALLPAHRQRSGNFLPGG